MISFIEILHGLVSVVGTVACMVMGVKIVAFIIGEAKAQRIYETLPRLVPYDPLRLCVERHDWNDVKLMFPDGTNMGMRKVCVECGVINGDEDVMLSKEAIERVIYLVHLLEEKEKAEKEFNSRISKIMAQETEEYIKANLTQIDNSEEINKLANFVIGSREDAVQKIAAEMKNRRELEQLYESWTKKVRKD